jgi:hypothetical protein
MRFHIDTRSAAQEDRGSQVDFRNTLSASGSFGYGPWGASASMTNTIGYVSTQKTQTTEEMNTDLDLNSSVELVFKTDYLPLERMAGQGQIDRIKVNTLNPDAETKALTEARTERQKRYAESEKSRREPVDKSIAPPPPPPPPPKAGEPGSAEAAEKARKEGEERKKKDDEEKKKKKTEEQTTMAATMEAPTMEAPTMESPTMAAPTMAASAFAQSTGENGAGQPDVVFVPTPDETVDEMLQLAGVRANDLVYDLGCGDGRLVIAAAKRHGCLAVGFDIDSKRVEDARRNVEFNNLSHLVRIEQRDLFTVDLSDADVVFVYLLPELNVRLIPQFDRMKPGSRIISHDFDLAGIIPDRIVQVYLEKHRCYKTVYRWITPLRRARSPVRHQWTNSRGIVQETVCQ